MFLKQSLLDTIRQRAAGYDKSNRFPFEDYDDLKAAGYFKAFVPQAYQGFGLSLKEIAREQTRLAMAAPATALGINMHQIIVGTGQYILNHGNEKGWQILEDAAAGELCAFAISEPANDRVLFGSICTAEPNPGGGYRFYGPKVFISMIEQCTRILTYATDHSNHNPLSVFAYIVKDENFITVDPNWDTLGMRATQSHNVNLEGIPVFEENVLTKAAPGPSDDPVVFGIFAYFELLLAATYHGIGKRALEIGIETVKKRRSIAQNTTYDQDKNIRWRIAEAALLLDGIQTQIDALCDDVENNVDHGPLWMPRLSAIKNRAVETSKQAVEEMIRVSGGRSYYNDQELSRLLRDVYAGLFQPSDQESLHDAWANVLLGRLK